MTEQPSAIITMLGTGSAFPRSSYNSCCVVDTPGLRWLVDCGGGNGIMKRLEACGIETDSLTHLFITHSHTDHILGAVWIVRSVINRHLAGAESEPFHIYANAETLEALDEICRLTLLPAHYSLYRRLTERHDIDRQKQADAGDCRLEFFDCQSENTRQSGFRMRVPGGRTLACFGDESLTERNIAEADGADMVVCGAFCSYEDRERFKPYEKHHFTVRDVALMASKARIGHLVLWHCEDITVDRDCRYRAEASEFFGGKVSTPADGDSIAL